MKLGIHAKLMPTELQVQTPNAGVSGVLYLELEGVYFPGLGWHDMTARVLGDWIQRAMSIAHSDSEVMHGFMDGPYLFGLLASEKSPDVMIRLYVDAEKPLGEYQINFGRYLALLRGATRTVLRQARELGVDKHRDLLDLQVWLQQLIAYENDIRVRVNPSTP